MFCPKCGVRNLEDAKFCRSCGSDIRLVPQAMQGRLPEGSFGVLEVEEQEKEGKKERKYKFKEPPTVEKGLENIFGGIAFLIIFALGFVYFPKAFWIWVWFIIPALEHAGKGLGQIIRARRERPSLTPAEPFDPEQLAHAGRQEQLPAPDTNELLTPRHSVTEGTTRRLAVPADNAPKDF